MYFIFYTPDIIFSFMKQTFIVYLACVFHDRHWGYSFEQNKNDPWLNEM